VRGSQPHTYSQANRDFTGFGIDAGSTMLTRVYDCAEPAYSPAVWNAVIPYEAGTGCGDAEFNCRPAAPSPVDCLYLFACGVRWHRERDTAAGWELIHFLRSEDGDGRTLAADLLAKTEYSRLLVRDLRRAQAKLNRKPANRAPTPERKPPGKASAMHTPYGLNIIDSCMTCSLRRNHWFCGLSPDALKVLAQVSHPAIYPGGALLFVEGQTPRGAYMLCSGKAKLSTTSRDGKVLILKIAGEGEVLGLSAAISGQPFEMTAETTSPCQVNFIEREGLLHGIESNGELGLHASLALSREFQSAYRDIHDLILARSSAGKLAKLLLSWMPHRDKTAEPSEVRIRASLTHEEMAQMIGSSRETVTRLLGDLRRKEFIRLEGATMVIQDRTALEDLAA
jgi:CRP/FNR family transcriptional regulator, cyclic AMP receptor protein